MVRGLSARNRAMAGGLTKFAPVKAGFITSMLRMGAWPFHDHWMNIGENTNRAEMFDPRNPAGGWELCATMSIPRGYHSAAILLPDGSILMGGDRPGMCKSGETTQHERYFPNYYSLPGPAITNAPADLTYRAVFDVDTPTPASIVEAVLLRPGAVTHGFNMSQRLIECVVRGSSATAVHVEAPPNANIAPPGPYLLFILTPSPSMGRWVRLT
jgi:hypothetical protein